MIGYLVKAGHEDLARELMATYEVESDLKGLWKKVKNNSAVKKLWGVLSMPLTDAIKKFVTFGRQDYDDALDEIVENIAPKMVKTMLEYEIKQEILKYAKNRNMKIKDIPSDIRKDLIKKVHDEVEHEITEDAVMHAGRSVVHKLNPKKLSKSFHTMVKKYGWKLGITMATIEIVEHVVIPGIGVSMGSPSITAIGTLPIGEVIIYPILFRTVFKGVKLPENIDDAPTGGNIEWFCKLFPGERMCKEVYI